MDWAYGGLASGIGILLLASAFFSGSETAVMAVNRYRLQYRARSKSDQAARTLYKLLAKPQKLLGMVLIGNTFMNMLMASLSTWLTIELLGESFVMLQTILLTLLVLVFAEVMPKTIAAHFADSLAYRVSWVLAMLLWLFYPLVWLVNLVTDNLLSLFGLRLESPLAAKLSKDELRGLIHAKRLKPRKSGEDDFQHMLVGVLDLDSMTVNDVMIPRQEIKGVNLQADIRQINAVIMQSNSMHLIVYDGEVNNIQGMLHVHDVLRLMQDCRLTAEAIAKILVKPHFVPEGTRLNKQLENFKAQQYSTALVVDEYGEVCGAVKIEDIIEEIIGEFSMHSQITLGSVRPNKDGSYGLSGQLAVRDVNRILGFELPEDGPNTIGGLVLEHLECLPSGCLGLEIEGYRIEVLEVTGKVVQKVKIYPLGDTV
ncbi:MAG: CNNM domain-containing protein [Pseudomonadota bacterium]|nr:CNNM domain-containing protein [Pseudomonadota bacterium]